MKQNTMSGPYGSTYTGSTRAVDPVAAEEILGDHLLTGGGVPGVYYTEDSAVLVLGLKPETRCVLSLQPDGSVYPLNRRDSIHGKKYVRSEELSRRLVRDGVGLQAGTAPLRMNLMQASKLRTEKTIYSASDIFNGIAPAGVYQGVSGDTVLVIGEKPGTRSMLAKVGDGWCPQAPFHDPNMRYTLDPAATKRLIRPCGSLVAAVNLN